MSDKTSYWKHRLNLSLFSYDDKIKENNHHTQVLSDWNRQIRAGNSCSHYINGSQLSTLRTKEFNTIKELETFFKENLFHKCNDEKNRKTLALGALDHFYQSGLQHATNFCLKNKSTYKKYQCQDPQTRIDFTSTNEGVNIKEYNKYNKVVTEQGRLISDPKNPPGYHASTTSTYTFTTNDKGELTFGPKDIDIDCPTRKVSEIFDKRSLWEKIVQYIKNMTEDWKSKNEKDVEKGPSMKM